jgi:hypothetical protein
MADAPRPAERPVQRLAQMRELARDFKAATTKSGSPHDLRLLTQPLYRYEDKASNILDGALFAFAEGNDPEALLHLAAAPTGDGKGHQWHYTLARLTTFPVVVRLHDREVFAVEAYGEVPQKAEHPFIAGADEPFSLRE